jgi:hypothetical protein
LFKSLKKSITTILRSFDDYDSSWCRYWKQIDRK